MCEYIHVNPIFFGHFGLATGISVTKTIKTLWWHTSICPLNASYFSIEYVDMQDRYVDMQHDIP